MKSLKDGNKKIENQKIQVGKKTSINKDLIVNIEIVRIEMIK